ncbi:MAG TPA: hypothetical protein VFK89_08490 [Actinomycetota bacterium]|nr:hypothetical protein [Actinomycetota bacterium]
MRAVTDPSVADWVVNAIHPFAQDVGSVIPDTFQAYLRVLHPAEKRDGSSSTPVTWRQIAEANGKQFHPEMQFEFLVPDDCFDGALNCRRSQEGLWDEPPELGEIPGDIARALAELLRGFTGTPESCYFAYWEGWGDPVESVATKIGETPPEPAPLDFAGSPRAERDRAAKFLIPGRGFYLYEGAITEATTSWMGDLGNRPSLWWPADRSWCVATEIDFVCTYVAGPEGIAEALVNDPRIEAVPTAPTDGIGRAADRINGPK